MTYGVIGRTMGGRTTMWVWLMWYKNSQVDRHESAIERDARKAYKHLKAPIVYLDSATTHEPFPAKDLVSQVMLVHACVRRKFSKSGLPRTEHVPQGKCAMRGAVEPKV